MKIIIHQNQLYWPLIKSLQTGLLVATGLAGYMTVRCPVFNLPTMAGLFISLVASISGSTILNMWWDRDIDSKMERTKNRPLASGRIDPDEAFWVGLVLALFGVGLAVVMNALYGLIIFAGLFIDVVIYTIWLKRRACWSIIWGGISGGMPILAGRVLGLGSFDWVGIMLSLGILLWIPTHILTFNMRYFDDYKTAGVPTFASAYGFKIYPNDNCRFKYFCCTCDDLCRIWHRYGMGFSACAWCPFDWFGSAGSYHDLPPVGADQFWFV